MLFEYFSIILEGLPSVHARLPRLGPQEDHYVGRSEGLLLLLIRKYMDFLNSHVAAVL